MEDQNNTEHRSYATEQEIFGGITGWVPYYSKGRLNAEGVLSHPTASQAINLIAGKIASMPIDVWEEYGQKERRIDDDHRWQWGLNVRPHPIATKTRLFNKFIENIIVEGNGYLEIDRENETLSWLDPRETRITKVKGKVLYETVVDGKIKTLFPEDIIHVAGRFTHDGITGRPIYVQMESALKGAVAKFVHVEKTFENGCMSKSVVKIPSTISKNKEKRNELEKAISAVLGGGAETAGGILYVDEDVEVEGSVVNNQFTETSNLMAFDIILIANAIGVTPTFLGAAINSSFKSLTEERQKYLDNLEFLLVSIEEELSSKLIDEYDINANQRKWIQFNRKAILTMNPKEEVELLNLQMAVEGISKQYYRRKLDLPVEDVDGEKYFTPSGCTPYIGGKDPVNDPKPEPIQTPVVDPLKTDGVAEEAAPQQQEQVKGNATEDATEEVAKAERSIKSIEKDLKRLVERIAKGEKRAVEHAEIWNENLGHWPTSLGYLESIGNMIDNMESTRRIEAVKSLPLEQWAKEIYG